MKLDFLEDATVRCSCTDVAELSIQTDSWRFGKRCPSQSSPPHLARFGTISTVDVVERWSFQPPDFSDWLEITTVYIGRSPHNSRKSHRMSHSVQLETNGSMKQSTKAAFYLADCSAASIFASFERLGKLEKWAERYAGWRTHEGQSMGERHESDGLWSDLVGSPAQRARMGKVRGPARARRRMGHR